MIRVKQKDLDYKSGLGYQRFKEIEENKQALENQQKLNKAVDYILSKQGIKKPTIVEKHEAMRKVFDKSAKELKQRQNMQMQKVSRKMDKQMKLITSMYAKNKLDDLKPKIKESSIKQMASLASPVQSGESTLPKALLPPTSIPKGIEKNTMTDMENLAKSTMYVRMTQTPKTKGKSQKTQTRNISNVQNLINKFENKESQTDKKKLGRPPNSELIKKAGQKQQKKILDFMASNPSPSTPASMTKIK